MSTEILSAMNRLVSAAAREAALRRAVYPGQVNRGKMSRAKAHEEIAAMDRVTSMLILLRDHPGSVLNRSTRNATEALDFMNQLDRVVLTPIAYNPKETATDAV